MKCFNNFSKETITIIILIFLIFIIPIISKFLKYKEGLIFTPAQYSCLNSNKYLYKGTCNDSLPTNDGDCATAGGKWVGTTCFMPQKPDAQNKENTDMAFCDSLSDPPKFWLQIASSGNTCSLTAPTNAASCNAAGYWWYNGKCNREKPTNQITCNGATAVSSDYTKTPNGNFWYDDDCNRSLPTDETTCKSKNELYWFPSSTNQVSGSNRCNIWSPTGATACNGLPTYWWYDSKCNKAEPSNQASCEGATSTNPVTTSNGNFWYYDSVNSASKCMKTIPNSKTSCNNATINDVFSGDVNDDAGYFWYNSGTPNNVKCYRFAPSGASGSTQCTMPGTDLYWVTNPTDKKEKCFKYLTNDKKICDSYDNSKMTYWYYPTDANDPDNTQKCQIVRPTTESTCKSANYYWYKTFVTGKSGVSGCNKQMPTVKVACDMADDTFFYYNNTCTNVSPNSQTLCNQNGYYWYNNTCNKNLPVGATGIISNKDACDSATVDGNPVQAGGIDSGFFHFTGPSGQKCYTTAPTGATACNSANYWWYGNKCNKTPPTDQATCNNSGYYWYLNASDNVIKCNRNLPKGFTGTFDSEILSAIPKSAYSSYENLGDNKISIKFTDNFICNNTVLDLDGKIDSGYMYYDNNTVDANAKCYPTGATNSAACSKYGFYYLNDINNNNVKKCVKTLPTNQTACRGADVAGTTFSYWWYSYAADNANQQCYNTGPSGDAGPRACNNNGYFWYNNTCNKSMPTGKTGCELAFDENRNPFFWDTTVSPNKCVRNIPTKTPCVTSGYHWYNTLDGSSNCYRNAPQDVSTCDLNQDQFYYFFDNKCSKFTSATGVTQVTCAKNPNYYYYTDSTDNIKKCKTLLPTGKTACNVADVTGPPELKYWWYSYAADNANPQCYNTGPSGDAGPRACNNNGFYWYNNTCNKSMPTGKTGCELAFDENRNPFFWDATVTPNKCSRNISSKTPCITSGYHWYNTLDGNSNCYRNVPQDVSTCDLNQDQFYYFFDNKCSKYTSATGVTQVTCAKNPNYYYYTDSTDKVKKCKTFLPTGQYACNMADVTGPPELKYWWYSYDADNANQQCYNTGPSGDAGPRACNNNGYFWYNNTCNKSMPTGKTGCELAFDENKNPFFWDATVTPNKCSRNIPTKTPCITSGYYWYNTLDGSSNCYRNVPQDVSTCDLNQDQFYYFFDNKCSKFTSATGVTQVMCAKNPNYYYYTDNTDKVKKCKTFLPTGQTACNTADVTGPPELKYWWYSYDTDTTIPSQKCYNTGPSGDAGPRACNSNGFYWYNNACNKSLPTGKTGCDLAMDENNKATFYWDPDTSKCMSKYLNPSGPYLSQAKCQKAGTNYFWYKDLSNNYECYKSLPKDKATCDNADPNYGFIQSSNTCVTDINKMGANNAVTSRQMCEQNNYWFYKGTASATTAQCFKSAPTGKTACIGTGMTGIGIGQTGAAVNGYYWYNDTDGNQKCFKNIPNEGYACNMADNNLYFYYDNTNNLKCQNVTPKLKKQCTSAGYYWYNNACNRTLPTAENDCNDANFDWDPDNNACDARMRPKYAINSWINIKSGYGNGLNYQDNGNVGKIVDVDKYKLNYRVQQTDANGNATFIIINEVSIDSLNSNLNTTTTTMKPIQSNDPMGQAILDILKNIAKDKNLNYNNVINLYIRSKGPIPGYTP